MRLNFKFYSNDDHSLTVKAKRKDNGKWAVVGTCHPASKTLILTGRIELIQFTRLERA
jgi:hypothetical protein